METNGTHDGTHEHTEAAQNLFTAYQCWKRGEPLPDLDYGMFRDHITALQNGTSPDFVWGRHEVKTALEYCSKLQLNCSNGHNGGLALQDAIKNRMQYCSSCSSVFPHTVFPQVIQDVCEGVAKSMEAPREMCYMAALGVISAASRARVQVVGYWYEYGNLYILIFAYPGERKTPVLSILRRPLDTLQREALEQWQHDTDAWQHLGKDAREHTPPPDQPCLFTTNATMESLIPVMQANNERVAVITDEGRGLLSNIAGRYTKGMDGGLDFYCNAWSGQAYIYHRAKNPVGIYLHNPNMTLLLMQQPDMLSRLGENEAVRDSGFLSRCLISVPTTMVGQRQHPDYGESSYVPQDTLEAYNAMVMRIVGDTDTYHLDRDAYNTRQAYLRELEPGLREYGEHRDVSDWVNKVGTQVIRISLLLAQCNRYAHARNMRDAFSNNKLVVTKENMDNAIVLTRYCMDNWKAAHKEVHGINKQLRDAQRVLRWIQGRSGNGDTEVGLRDVQTYNNLKDKRYALEIMATLAEWGVVTEHSENAVKRRQRYHISAPPLDL